MNYTPNCIPKPTTMNPASWILDVIAENPNAATEKTQENAPASANDIDAAVTTVAQSDQAVTFADYFLQAPHSKDVQNTIQVLCESQNEHVKVNVNDYGQTTKVMLYEVYKRTWISNWRDSISNFGVMMTLFFLGVLLGLVYLQINDDDYAGMNSKIAAIFSAVAFGSMMQMQLVLPNIIGERAVYYREQATKCYPSWIYSTAVSVVDIPYCFIADLFLIIPFYFMSGMRYEADAFFNFLLIIFLTSLFSTAFGHVCGAYFSSFVISVQIVGFFVTFAFLFCGLFIRPNQIPVGWLFVYYLNPYPKSVIAALLNEYECSAPDPYTNFAQCPWIYDENHTQITKHAFINQILNAGYSSYGAQLAYLVAYIVFFRCLFVYVLRYVNHLKR
jgi:hypothetical protein